MAKKLTKSQLNLLSAIASATKLGENFFIEKNDDTKALHDGKFIEVNTQITDDNGNVAARATAEGIEYSVKNAPKGNKPVAATPSQFALISGAVPPPTKRGGGSGAPAKYPFDQMDVNISFFVADGEVTSGDAVKSLQSSVASVNAENTRGTGEMETVTRTKRGEGNKAVLDAAGNKVKETIQREKREPVKKWTVRPVKSGVEYGGWKAPANGALVTRVM